MGQRLGLGTHRGNGGQVCQYFGPLLGVQSRPWAIAFDKARPLISVKLAGIVKLMALCAVACVEIATARLLRPFLRVCCCGNW